MLCNDCQLLLLPITRCHTSICCISGRSRISHGGRGIDPFKGGHGPLTQVLFGKNACKNERIRSHMGVCAPGTSPKIHQCVLSGFCIIRNSLVSLIGDLHNWNSLIRLFSLISLMVKYPCLCTQNVHINGVFQWTQICNLYSCAQRFTLNDHIKHTSLV